MVVAPIQRDLDFALEGELERVRQQIEDDLLPLRAIDADRLGKRRAVDDELHPGAFDERVERARELGRQRGQIGRLERELQAPRLDAGEIEQAVHQPQQPHAASMNRLEVFTAQRSFGLRQRFLDKPEDQRQRRPELVADVAEEGRLRAVDLGERFGAPLLCVVCAGVGHDVGRLIRGGPKELPIPIIERTVWADASHEKRVRRRLARTQERQDDGSVGPCIPATWRQ